MTSPEPKRADTFPLTLVLNGLPKMTNTSRTHWRALDRETKRWKKIVNDDLGAKGFYRAGVTPLTKAKITITRHSSKCPDFDGLVSGGKRLIDALKFCSVIEDDSMAHIGQPTYLWEKAPHRHGFVTILVEEA